MLVISRKKNETIVIGDIEVTIIEIRGDKVRLGIQSPANMPVHRKEVYEAIQRPTPTLWNEQTTQAITGREVQTAKVTAPAIAPVTLTIPGAAAAQLDKLRQSAELSRERAVEELLCIIDRADVASLCDLERRLS